MSSKVIEKLKAHKASNEGNQTITLPETGVEVTFPKFRKHGDWTRALSMAKNKLFDAQVIYLCKIATFDGEKITTADFRAYIPTNDANELLSEVFGDDEDDWDEDEDEAGKPKAEKKA